MRKKTIEDHKLIRKKESILIFCGANISSILLLCPVRQRSHKVLRAITPQQGGGAKINWIF